MFSLTLSKLAGTSQVQRHSAVRSRTDVDIPERISESAVTFKTGKIRVV